MLLQYILTCSILVSTLIFFLSRNARWMLREDTVTIISRNNWFDWLAIAWIFGWILVLITQIKEQWNNSNSKTVKGKKERNSSLKELRRWGCLPHLVKIRSNLVCKTLFSLLSGIFDEDYMKPIFSAKFLAGLKPSHLEEWEKENQKTVNVSIRGHALKYISKSILDVIK